jgi:hypothetical protein
MKTLLRVKLAQVMAAFKWGSVLVAVANGALPTNIRLLAQWVKTLASNDHLAERKIALSRLGNVWAEDGFKVLNGGNRRSVRVA